MMNSNRRRREGLVNTLCRSGPTLVLGLLLAVGCSDDEAEPMGPSPCDDLPPVEVSEVVTLEEMELALDDAGDRLLTALEEGWQKEQLRTSLVGLSKVPKGRDTRCHLFLTSKQMLDQLDDLNDPETAVERESIRLVLDLTLASLKGT